MALEKKYAIAKLQDFLLVIFFFNFEKQELKKILSF